MIAKCKIASVTSITDVIVLEHVRQHIHLDDVGLLVGKCYPVFGIAFWAGIPWYLVSEEIDDEYPILHCSAFFDLIDTRVCEDWRLVLGPSNVGTTALLPEQWASDPCFLEKMIDGDENAVAFFRELKRRASEETLDGTLGSEKAPVKTGGE